MRTYIAPIGYDSTRVTRPVLSQGVERNTRIVLLVPTSIREDSRGTQAVEDVRRMVEQIEPTVEVETVEIQHDDFEVAISTCCSVIDEAGGEVTVIFGGGARDIFHSLTVAALSRTDSIHESYQFSDIDGEVRERNLPDLTAHVPTQALSTLRTISRLDAQVALTEITNSVDVSKSTVTRNVKMLESEGLVTSETHGKTKVVELTLTGRLLINRP